jgi:hypothetical protein
MEAAYHRKLKLKFELPDRTGSWILDMLEPRLETE